MPVTLQQRVQIPAIGGSLQLQHAGWQVVLERSRGGLQVLAHDGRRSRRVLVGAAEGGELELRVVEPRHPVVVRLSTDVVLVPGGRLRGYLVVPLVVEVGWAVGRNGSTRRERLVELAPPELRTAWTESAGYVHVVDSPLWLRWPARLGEAEAVVPVVLRNAGSSAVRAGELRIGLSTGCVRGLRGGLLAPARRLVFDGEGWTEQVRP